MTSSKIDNQFKQILLSAGILFVVVVFSRIIPHPWNFTAVGSAGLIAGYLALNSWTREKNKVRGVQSVGLFLVPVLAMFLTDFLIFGFYEGVVFNYIALGVASVLGGVWKNSNFETSWKLGAGLSFLSSLTFFVLSNFAVWKFSGMYALSLEGLLQCYVMALPFFHWQVLGDLFYLGLFVLALSPVARLSRVVRA